MGGIDHITVAVDVGNVVPERLKRLHEHGIAYEVFEVKSASPFGSITPEPCCIMVKEVYATLFVPGFGEIM